MMPGSRAQPLEQIEPREIRHGADGRGRRAPARRKARERAVVTAAPCEGRANGLRTSWVATAARRCRSLARRRALRRGARSSEARACHGNISRLSGRAVHMPDRLHRATQQFMRRRPRVPDEGPRSSDRRQHDRRLVRVPRTATASAELANRIRHAVAGADATAGRRRAILRSWIRPWAARRHWYVAKRARHVGESLSRPPERGRCPSRCRQVRPLVTPSQAQSPAGFGEAERRAVCWTTRQRPARRCASLAWRRERESGNAPENASRGGVDRRAPPSAGFEETPASRPGATSPLFWRSADGQPLERADCCQSCCRCSRGSRLRCPVRHQQPATVPAADARATVRYDPVPPRRARRRSS